VALVLTWPLLMLWFFMTVIGMRLCYAKLNFVAYPKNESYASATSVPPGIHKRICKLRTVHIE
jgi:hypothetical protein